MPFCGIGDKLRDFIHSPLFLPGSRKRGRNVRVGGGGQGSVLGPRPDRVAAASLPRRPQAQAGRATLQQRCGSCPARRRQPERAGGLEREAAAVLGAGTQEPAGPRPPPASLGRDQPGGMGSCSRPAPRRRAAAHPLRPPLPSCCCPAYPSLRKGKACGRGPLPAASSGDSAGLPRRRGAGGSRQSRTAPEDPRPSPDIRGEWALGSATAASPPGHQAEKN